MKSSSSRLACALVLALLALTLLSSLRAETPNYSIGVVEITVTPKGEKPKTFATGPIMITELEATFPVWGSFGNGVANVLFSQAREGFPSTALVRFTGRENKEMNLFSALFPYELGQTVTLLENESETLQLKITPVTQSPAPAK